tara:strand:+ start:1324 stop:1554 length:231 start_codon:yes stop_codon:yes gene_type:complete
VSLLRTLLKQHDLTPDDIKKLKQITPKIENISRQNKVLTALKTKDSSIDIKKVQSIMNKYIKKKPVKHGLKIKKKE